MLVDFAIIVSALSQSFAIFAAVLSTKRSGIVRRKGFILLCFCLLNLTSLAAQEATTANSGQVACPLAKVDVEQLPDLNVPRSGHQTLCFGKEIVAIGGHTTGFIPTATAEYYADGVWHLIPTVYEHDGGFSVKLDNGKVLIVGGAEKHLGIGQTFVAEMYDSERHQFEGFGCTDMKRTLACGIRLDEGKVVISGNWYTDDAIELYDGEGKFKVIKEVAQPRTLPYIFQTSQDDAIIFSARDNYGKSRDTILIDRLKGEPYQEELFNTWKPLERYDIFDCEDCFIGNQSKEEYAWLFPVVNKEGQIAIAQTKGDKMSLLPTVCPVPTKSPWGQRIFYYSIIADKKAQRAYLLGRHEDASDNSRIYAVCIEYGKVAKGKEAPLTLYYSDPLPYHGGISPALTPDGDIVIVGGVNWREGEQYTNDNFHPASTVYLLHFGTPMQAAGKSGGLWIWIVGVGSVVLLLLITAFLYHRRRQSRKGGVAPSGEIQEEQESGVEIENPIATKKTMMERIEELMISEKLFLDSELKVSDIANRIGTHRNYIADCLKTNEGCSFNQYVNRYRIEHAKRLLHYHPEKKIATISLESGFANETSFYRTFKAITGMTPKEWLASMEKKNKEND